MKTISFFLFCCTAICLSGEIFSPIPLGSLAKSKKTFAYPNQSPVLEPKGEKEYYLGFRISPRIGSLGIGLEMAQGIRPNFGIRFGYSVFAWEKNGERSGNDYDLDFTLSNFATLRYVKTKFFIPLIYPNAISGPNSNDTTILVDSY